jgi:hypothetical protein
MAVTLAAAAASAVLAQPAPAASGHWEGEIEAPDRKVAFVIDMAPDVRKVWSGAFTLPGQGMSNMPLADVTVKDDSVSFGVQGIPGNPRFVGMLKEGTITGQVTQGDVKMPFSMKRTGDAKIEKREEIPPISKELEGAWEGSLEVQGRTLRLRFLLANQASGGAKGTLISLDQGGIEIPITKIGQTGSKVSLEVAAIKGGFDGELKGSELAGEWSQSGNAMALTLTKK